MYCGMWSTSRVSGPAPVAGLYTDDERLWAGSTLPPGIRFGKAVDGLEAGGAHPRAERRGLRGRRRRGVAQEPLHRGDHRRGLLRRRGGADELEARTAVGHGADDASAAGTVDAMVSPGPLKPRPRGGLHQWAFYVSLVAGALLVALAPSGRAAV